MASPWVNLLSNQAGGGLNAAMKANNSLANENILRQINQIKKTYLPTTLSSEAASKLAYANLMAPQFLAKLLQNQGAIANMGDPAARAALQKAVQAGMGGGSGQNYLNNIPQHTGVGQPSTNSFSGHIVNAFKNLIGNNNHKPNSNSLITPLEEVNVPNGNRNPMKLELRGGFKDTTNNLSNNQDDNVSQKEGINNINDEELSAYDQWLRSDDGQREINKGEKGNYPTPKEALDWQKKQNNHNETWAEKTGRLKGEEKQGEEAGKYRAKAQQEIGDSQLALSHSGAVLNRLTDIVKNPEFQNMRSKIPFFQDKQLNYLLKTGTPEQKKIIGDFLSTSESFIASTVQGFSGKPLVREFDLAQRQKINPSDPVHVAEGKLQSAIALHDIAEKKNDIISGLLDKGVNLSDAVKRANKMVDVSAIEKKTNELLRDKPTEEDIAYMAKKRGISEADVKKQLKARGLL